MAPGPPDPARRMPGWWTAPTVTVHHTQSDAGRESHYERRRQEVYDGGDLRLVVIVRHHYAAVHAAVMAGEPRALVAQFAGEVVAVDDRRIAAPFDVHQEHRLDVAWRRHCGNDNVCRSVSSRMLQLMGIVWYLKGKDRIYTVHLVGYYQGSKTVIM